MHTGGGQGMGMGQTGCQQIACVLHIGLGIYMYARAPAIFK